ncbi:hypothetical protein GCM10009583_13320 [Ornithinicoccus hortensis]|uniref:Uncharacterized protein n=2 Tax=Ornithinicoccus hortensis TaxID=82346 RepID=A0A542YRV8_9MICO|nr:hypothetical protein FB467_1955 [Ornithinicoccus hortensis]
MSTAGRDTYARGRGGLGRMGAMTSVFASGEAGHHVVNELPLEPVMFGVIAIIVFLALLGLLWSFRNTLALDPVEHHSDAPGQDGSAGSQH